MEPRVVEIPESEFGMVVISADGVTFNGFGPLQPELLVQLANEVFNKRLAQQAELQKAQVTNG